MARKNTNMGMSLDTVDGRKFNPLPRSMCFLAILHTIIFSGDVFSKNRSLSIIIDLLFIVGNLLVAQAQPRWRKGVTVSVTVNPQETEYSWLIVVNSGY